MQADGLTAPRDVRQIAAVAAAAIFAGTLLYYFAFLYKFYVFGLAAALAAIVLTRGTSMPLLRYALPIFLFHGWVALSTLWSPIRDVGMAQAALDVIYLLFAVIPFAQPDIGKKTFSVWLIQAYAAALLLCVAYDYVTIRELVDVQKGSFRSLFGILFLTAIPLYVGTAVINRSILAWIGVAAMMAVGLQIDNRVFELFSLPILLASLFIAADLRGVRFKFAYVMGFMFVGLSVVIVLQMVGMLGFADSRLSASGTNLSLGDTVFFEANYASATSVDVERRLATQVAIDSFQMSPIIGAGYISTPFYTGQLTHFETVAHGLVTGILSECGLIGAALFLIACVLSINGYLLRARLSVGNDQKWAYLELLSLLATLIGGMFHQPNHDFALYLLIGGGLASRRLLHTVARPQRSHARADDWRRF